MSFGFFVISIVSMLCNPSKVIAKCNKGFKSVRGGGGFLIIKDGGAKKRFFYIYNSTSLVCKCVVLRLLTWLKAFS